MSFSKEEEIRPRDLFKQLLALVEQDAHDLRATAVFEETPCPACASARWRESFSKHGYAVAQCDDCFSLFVNPRPTKDSLDGFYRTSRSARFFVDAFYPAVERSRREKLLPERAARLEAFLTEAGISSGVVVDSGAGQGFFLDALRERLPGFAFRAIEPNPSFAATCRAKGFETVESIVEEATCWGDEADVVTCFEVFEHVHHPERFLQSLKRLLKPGGCLLITSLTGDGFDIQVLREQADIVAPPQHLNYLSVEGYRRLFERVGFQSARITTPGRLDVNIVENKEAERPGTVDGFASVLLRQSDEARRAFQSFLAENRLSSHIWVFAVR
jgi:SAM-dependent methyltransferase